MLPKKQRTNITGHIVRTPSYNNMTSFQQCYKFLSMNQYSEKANGLFTYFLRNSVGDINFSDMLDDIVKFSSQSPATISKHYIDNIRNRLLKTDRSIEKCLMINRFLSYLENNSEQYNALVFDLINYMKSKMIDENINSNNKYPDDFRKREQDFNLFWKAQNMRRLFYLSDREARNPPNLIKLQNRTTEHLNYIIDTAMRYNSMSKGDGLKEIERILTRSFIITDHPHRDVNPVMIYEKKSHNMYTIKMSSTIVSLLHDFIKSHPNIIELSPIVLHLLPSACDYRITEVNGLGWKTVELQPLPDNKSYRFQYVELYSINICPSCEQNASRFSDGLYNLRFIINIRLNLSEFNISRSYQIPIDSLPFAISSHTSHIPHLLSKIVLNDIQSHIKSETNEIETLVHFLVRYFIHRTGINPNEYLTVYLKEELNNAKNSQKGSETSEDIFLEFLSFFLNQVEFMAKHPIIGMLYADGLCLGICNSDHSTNIMKKSAAIDSPIIAIRFTSLKHDALANVSKSLLKTMKAPQCPVRVDTFNLNTGIFQKRTFNTEDLLNDLNKFICTTVREDSARIRVLCNLIDKQTVKNYKSLKDFTKYYHTQLRKFSVTDETYKPITNLIENIEEIDSGICPPIENSPMECAKKSPNNMMTKSECENSAVTSNSTQDFNDNKLRTRNKQSIEDFNVQDIVQYVLSRDDIVTELYRRLGISNTLALRANNCTAYPQNEYTTIPYQQQEIRSSTSIYIEPPYYQRVSIPIQTQQNSYFDDSNLTNQAINCSSSAILNNVSISPSQENLLPNDFQIADTLGLDSTITDSLLNIDTAYLLLVGSSLRDMMHTYDIE